MDRVYFLSPWLLAQPRALLWPTKWSGKSQFKTKPYDVLRVLFTFLCLCYYHQKSLPWVTDAPSAWVSEQIHGNRPAPVTHKPAVRSTLTQPSPLWSSWAMKSTWKSIKITTDALKSLSLVVICYTTLLWKFLTDASLLKIKDKKQAERTRHIIFLTCKLTSYLC